MIHPFCYKARNAHKQTYNGYTHFRTTQNVHDGVSDGLNASRYRVQYLPRPAAGTEPKRDNHTKSANHNRFCDGETSG